MDQIRVRFAPSPTGPLHIGGLRTALFNYLFAKKNGGSFILRIEDTDRLRYVEGAMEYIFNTLDWMGIQPDEGIRQGGEYGPYLQSERKEIYAENIHQLIENGFAYYAFDTSEELEQMRSRLKEAKSDTQHYNYITRGEMKNSLTLSEAEVKQRINNGEDYVIRLRVPENENIKFTDIIRGEVEFNSSNIDDKVLIKSDGLPTYHLANVVDDHLMKISHVIRGEEWLSSTPIHVLLYRFFGWESTMPSFAHLPLLLKPDGKGKLSKRDADQAGFPIFPLSWKDPSTGEISEGFREKGFIPPALINFLVFLGWNPGTEKEIFSLEELCNEFSLERVHKSGSKFDFEKAKWYNQHYLRLEPIANHTQALKNLLDKEGISYNEGKVEDAVMMMKERVTFPADFFLEAKYLWVTPLVYDEKVIKKKWNEETRTAINALAKSWEDITDFDEETIRNSITSTLELLNIPMGKIMQPLRVCITGISGGPDLMSILQFLGKKEAVKRLNTALEKIK